jgi:hypothetical protein
MREQERTLARLAQVLDVVARPHRCNEPLPLEVRATLFQLGVPCNELTTREELVASLWARKRTLLMAIQPGWGGPAITPPSAA